MKSTPSTPAPAPIAGPIRDEKFARAYAHVYDHYDGAGISTYA